MVSHCSMDVRKPKGTVLSFITVWDCITVGVILTPLSTCTYVRGSPRPSIWEPLSFTTSGCSGQSGHRGLCGQLGYLIVD